MAERVHLAAQHRQAAVVRTAISGNNLELHADDVLEHRPVELRGRARGRRRSVLAIASSTFFTAAIPATHRARRCCSRMRPIQLNFGASTLRPGDTEDLVEVNRLIHHPDDGAVLRRHIIEVVGRPDAAGARHVLCTTTDGLPGRWLADMGGDAGGYRCRSRRRLPSPTMKVTVLSL